MMLFISLILFLQALTCPKNVHEGPIGLGTRVQYSEVAIAPGNVISDGMLAAIVKYYRVAEC